MSVERSHGRSRPRVPRPGEHAVAPDAVSPAPIRDPRTGRFVAGNVAGRLRSLRRRERDLMTLGPSVVAPWVRPFVSGVPRETSQFVEEVGGEDRPSLLAFASDAAISGALSRAYLALGIDPAADPETREIALGRAQVWLRERRQCLLSLRAEARAGIPDRRSTRVDLSVIATRLGARGEEAESEERDGGDRA